MRITALLVMVALAAVFTIGAAPAKDEYIELFNGNSLMGWDCDNDYWTVEDGAITGRSTAEKPLKHNTFAIWRGDRVSDFQLRLKYKISNDNSGVQYRSKEEPD